MRTTWALLGSIGILLYLFSPFGNLEQTVLSFQETTGEVSPPRNQPIPIVFKAKVAKTAVEALPGVFASYSVASVYVVECGDRYVMIDTGLLRDVEAHLDNFAKIGVDLERIDAIFTTHFHYDHVSGIARAKEILDCKVVAHRENVHAIETGDKLVTAREMPYIPGYAFPFPPSEVDFVVEDGDTLQVGPTEFVAYHLPGHTAGDTGYVWEDNLVIGDLLFQGGHSGWRDVHWGSNYDDLIDSMQRIKAINPKYCLPGHGRPWEYKMSESDKVISFADGEIKKGPASPVFFTGRSAGKREREPRRITIP